MLEELEAEIELLNRLSDLTSSSSSCLPLHALLITRRDAVDVNVYSSIPAAIILRRNLSCVLKYKKSNQRLAFSPSRERETCFPLNSSPSSSFHSLETSLLSWYSFCYSACIHPTYKGCISFVVQVIVIITATCSTTTGYRSRRRSNK